jgi:hypothetical protein
VPLLPSASEETRTQRHPNTPCAVEGLEACYSLRAFVWWRAPRVGLHFRGEEAHFGPGANAVLKLTVLQELPRDLYRTVV